jgi:hypothetical protein
MINTKLYHMTQTAAILHIPSNSKATARPLPIMEIRPINSQGNMAPQVPRMDRKAIEVWDQLSSAARAELSLAIN